MYYRKIGCDGLASFNPHDIVCKCLIIEKAERPAFLLKMYFIEKVMTSQKLYDFFIFLVIQITANPYVSFASECTLPLGICSIEERRKLPEF